MDDGVALPGFNEMVIHHAGEFEGFGAAGVVGASVELLGAFGCGADVEDGVVTVIAKLFLIHPHKIHHALPFFPIHISGGIHRAAVADQQSGFASGFRDTDHAVFHHQLEFEFVGFRDKREFLIFRQKIGTRLNEQCRRLGQCENRITQSGIFGFDSFQDGGFSGAGAACKYYSCNH